MWHRIGTAIGTGEAHNHIFCLYSLYMDYEQRLVIVESDLKEAKERIGRHSSRINTLEQNLLEEKGELTKLKGEVTVMGNQLTSIQKEQEEMNEKIDETNDKLDKLSERMAKYWKRTCIAVVLILIAIFIKDSNTGAQIGTILAILRP